MWRTVRVPLDLWRHRMSCPRSAAFGPLTKIEISSKLDPLLSSNWSRTIWTSSRVPPSFSRILHKVIFSLMSSSHCLQICLALTTCFEKIRFKVERRVSDGRISLMFIWLASVNQGVEGSGCLCPDLNMPNREEWESWRVPVELRV